MSKIADQDVAALEASLERFVSLCLDADWGTLMEMMADDVVFLPPDQPIIEGKKDVRKWFDEFPPIRAFESQLVQVDGRGDFAWVRGTFAMTVEPEAGQPESMKGKWTGSYRKQSDGSWLMASDVWNFDEPPT
jgi:ketosteroid isomerase-like protein